ncbi:43622_t:CDS:1, partial [Gigaspora margarita]
NATKHWECINVAKMLQCGNEATQWFVALVAGKLRMSNSPQGNFSDRV